MDRPGGGTTARSATGIAGLDLVTRGGLPRGRTTIVVGRPGTGKTVLALQTLAHGVRLGEPGLFVAFEEPPDRALQNVAAFGWTHDGRDLVEGIRMIDARPDPDLVRSGDVDLSGLLAIMDATVAASGGGRVVLDGIDALLALLPDPASARRELYRLHRWLTEREVTAMLTVKDDWEGGRTEVAFLEYLADCVIALRRELTEGTLQRSLWVVKYRGAAFDENEAPLLIGSRGIKVAAVPFDGPPVEASADRVTSGVAALDAMLEGGFFAGSSILLTGSPGTAKTTLAGAFAEASAARDAPTLIVSFDSTGPELVRNLRSVGIDLGAQVDRGMLKIESMRSSTASAELHLLRIVEAVERLGATCLVIDPISALAKPGNGSRSATVAERLVDWGKRQGMTLLMTSLLERGIPTSEATPIDVSTIADTWIHLENRTHAGERNRALSIVKSRGTAHSKQVRELILDRVGPTLAEVYRSGGAVLMGTERWEREEADRAAAQEERYQLDRRRRELESATEQVEREVAELQRRRQQLAQQVESLEQDAAARLSQRDRLATDIAERREGSGDDD